MLGSSWSLVTTRYATCAVPCFPATVQFSLPLRNPRTINETSPSLVISAGTLHDFTAASASSSASETLHNSLPRPALHCISECVDLTMEKFPDLDASLMSNGARAPSPLKSPSVYSNGSASRSDRWLPVPRSDAGAPNGLGWSAAGRSHNRQKSIGDAFRTIRARNGSVSQNAHEIADALRAPVSPKLIVCDSLSPRPLRFVSLRVPC